MFPSQSIRRLASWGIVGLLAAFVAMSGASLRADVIRLRNGGELRGELDRNTRLSGTDSVTIRTLSGAVVTVERSEIEFLARRSKLVEEYETRSRKIPDTIEAHEELAEWCRQNHLIDQRAEQLREVLRHDPDHVAANRSLGHVQHDGRWMTRDEMMAMRGMVKHKGRYVYPQEKELLEQAASELEAEKGWHAQIVSIRNRLQSSTPAKRVQAWNELRAIEDPHAVPALVKQFRDHADEGYRGLLVKLLARLGGRKALEALVFQSLRDPDVDIREAALASIREDQRPDAVDLYVRELRSDLNVVVERAARALQTIGNEHVVPQLIEALVTDHKYQVRVPVQTNSLTVSAGNNVVLPPDINLLLLTGQLPHGVIINDPSPTRIVQMKTVVVTQRHQNKEVREALKKLTGKDFGYDERSWRLWYAASKSAASSI